MAEHETTRRTPTIRVAVEHIEPTRGRARQFWRAFARSPVPMVTIDNEMHNQAANTAARLVFRLSLDDWRRRRAQEPRRTRALGTLAERSDRLMQRGSVTGRYDCELPDGYLTTDYWALANMLPGQHLVVFLPSSLPEDELAALLDDEPAPPTGPLTPREREVLTLIGRGVSSDQIAEELGVALTTVRTHTRNIVHKLGARNRPHAIALAIQHDMIKL